MLRLHLARFSACIGKAILFHTSDRILQNDMNHESCRIVDTSFFLGPDMSAKTLPSVDSSPARAPAVARSRLRNTETPNTGTPDTGTPEHPTPDTEHRTPEHRNTVHRTSGIGHRDTGPPDTEHRTPNTEHRTPKHRTPDTGTPITGTPALN